MRAAHILPTTMTRQPPGLYLITPKLADPAPFLPALEEALGAAEVTAILLRLEPADERTLVNRVKMLAACIEAHETAALVADPGPDIDLATLVTRGGADGGHAEDPARIEDLCRRLKDNRNVGAGGLRSKHDAMVAGELGVDYVLFGEPRPDGSLPPLEATLERAAWWAEIFQTVCVVHAPSLADIPRLAATGAEFVALGDAVWSHPDGPGAAVAQARAMLASSHEVEA